MTTLMLDDLVFHSQVGESNGNAKLTDAQVSEIKRHLIRWRHGMTAALARKYGVTGNCIQNIRDGRAWTHIETDPPCC